MAPINFVLVLEIQTIMHSQPETRNPSLVTRNLLQFKRRHANHQRQFTHFLDNIFRYRRVGA